MKILDRWAERLMEQQLHKEIDTYLSLIEGYKAHLYDIEHDDFPENECLRNERIRMMLVGTNCKNLEELSVYYKEQIVRFEKAIIERSMKLASYSKWQPIKQ